MAKRVKQKRALSSNIRRQVVAAAQLFVKFREAEPRFIRRLTVPNLPKVVMQIGLVDGILYTTTHGNKKVSYIHRFTGRSKPMLVTDSKGKKLYFLGGNYNFTEDGIVDKK